MDEERGKKGIVGGIGKHNNSNCSSCNNNFDTTDTTDNCNCGPVSPIADVECTSFDCNCCDICSCLRVGDVVTIGTKGGLIVVGSVTGTICGCGTVTINSSFFVTGERTFRLPPGTPSANVTICCKNIDFLIKPSVMINIDD